MKSIDEKDVSLEVAWYYETRVARATKALTKNGFEVEYVATRDEALAKVVESIPEGASIGTADSVTLHQIGFKEWLATQKGHEAWDPFAGGYSDTGEIERFELMRKALIADIFVTGTSAITLDGKVVNIDGVGNRVAAMCFGPRKVIYVAGSNKIVQDVDEALHRIHDLASPLNSKRHLEKHGIPIEKLPCLQFGGCVSCKSELKACRITVVVDGWLRRNHSSLESAPVIILVGEPLGL